jgi:arginine/lysine/ornithine decarboxylase
VTPAGQDDDDQRAAPIVEAIEAFRRRQQLSFTIPAHLGGLGRRADIAALAGADALRADVSMACGADTRDLSLRVQDRAQRLYARATGARQTLFSTNGSTMSVHVALMATAGPGQIVVVARNSHKSDFSAVVMSGAHVPAATAVGRVSCELITPYPPGVPLIAPGEVFTAAILTYLAEFLAAGGMVEGAEDPQLASVRVVAAA